MIELLKNWPKGERVPAISLRQPWPTAVLFYGKDIENRSNWPFRYRGPILIHSSKGKPYGEAIDWMARAAKEDGVPDEDIDALFKDGMYPDDLPFGCIVAAANLKDVFGPDDIVPDDHPAADSPWWGEASDFQLHLADVAPVKPVEFKGAVGIFYVPYDIAAALEVPDNAVTAYLRQRV